MSSRQEIFVVSELQFFDDYKRADAEWQVLRAYTKEENAYDFAISEIREYIEECVEDRDIEVSDYTEDEDGFWYIEDLEKERGKKPFKFEDWGLVKYVLFECDENDLKKIFEVLCKFLESANKPEFTMKRGKYFKVDTINLY